MTAADIAKTVYKTMDAKKAVDIKVLSVEEITSIADYFVICTANSVPQSDAIVDEIERVLSQSGVHHKLVEGERKSGWLLMDYGDVVVHVFLKNERSYYDIERIWRDAKEVTFR